VSESDAAPPSPDARAALLRKYRLLCLWRRGKDRAFATDTSEAHAREADGSESNQGVASRAAMRTLAEEFPGALRELDLLGLPELERRASVLARAASPDETAELARKLTAARGPLRDGDREPRPLGGKLSAAVLQAVARRFNVPVAQIAATLFPPRRGDASLPVPPRR
jgi:hypothetical protein